MVIFNSYVSHYQRVLGELWKKSAMYRGAYNALGALQSTKEPKNFNKVGWVGKMGKRQIFFHYILKWWNGDRIWYKLHINLHISCIICKCEFFVGLKCFKFLTTSDRHRLLRPTSTPRRMARRSAFFPCGRDEMGKLGKSWENWENSQIQLKLMCSRCVQLFSVDFPCPFPSGVHRCSTNLPGKRAFRCRRAASCLGRGRPAMWWTVVLAQQVDSHGQSGWEQNRVCCGGDDDDDYYYDDDDEEEEDDDRCVLHRHHLHYHIQESSWPS